jgi:hypothetical protein
MSILEVRQQMALVALGKKKNSDVCKEFGIHRLTWEDLRAQFGKYGRTIRRMDGTIIRSTKSKQVALVSNRPIDDDGNIQPLPKVAHIDLARAIEGVPASEVRAKERMARKLQKMAPKLIADHIAMNEVNVGKSDMNAEERWGTPGRKPSPRPDPEIIAAAKRNRKAAI